MYQEEYKRWLAADLQDADLNPELSKIEGNDEEIKDRFADLHIPEKCFSENSKSLYYCDIIKAELDIRLRE